jgi:hypothetical protein
MNLVPSFSERKAALIQKLDGEHAVRVERIQKHTAANCAADDHILEGFATGGSDGHYVSRCLLCDYRDEGWN